MLVRVGSPFHVTASVPAFGWLSPADDCVMLTGVLCPQPRFVLPSVSSRSSPGSPGCSVGSKAQSWMFFLIIIYFFFPFLGLCGLPVRVALGLRVSGSQPGHCSGQVEQIASPADCEASWSSCGPSSRFPCAHEDVLLSSSFPALLLLFPQTQGSKPGCCSLASCSSELTACRFWSLRCVADPQ